MLESQIEEWLAGINDPRPPPRAVIGPHAGYRYCGHVLAHAYRHIDSSSLRRVFLLGPSHHVLLRKCALSEASVYQTPLGPLDIDQETYAELRSSGAFESLRIAHDEAEHSLELHTPFIRWLIRDGECKFVPVIVGALSTESEARYGQILGRYLDDPSNLFVISSDFCHWGSRFQYTLYDKSKGPIWKSIRWLDELGMRSIETGDPAKFSEYLTAYRNTICGRHPIGVLLNMLQNCSTPFKVEFSCYDQSSRCHNAADSSVSYATALVTPTQLCDDANCSTV